jgi:hypothetical protein
MMTQQLGFSILTAPLAAIDRRSLSQAWYSALHLARNDSNAPHVAPKHLSGVVQPKGVASVPMQDPGRKEVATLRATRAPNESDRRLRGCDVSVERRATRSPLARKIERTFLDPRLHVRRATFSIDGTRSRIHVALQSAGGRVRLIALCAPSERNVVRDALAQARYALAARGIDLTLDTIGDGVCR